MVMIMNVIESINNINETIQEADMAVLESMMYIIDKREMFVECNNETLDEIFTESMSWFLESKNRERDKTPRNDIAKWMDEKGFWYTGDNPNRKKKCNRMYHFLQQHKFDPKTETYESDIETKDGKKERIKLDIKYGNSDMYVTTEDKIYLNTENVRAPQAVSDFALKHEEGHRHDIKRNERALESLKKGDASETKALAKEVTDAEDFIKHNKDDLNSHDAKSKELLADKYAVTHAKIRTKGAGSGHGQQYRNVNQHDVKKAFVNMAIDIDKDGLSSLKEFKDVKEDLLSCKKTIHKCLKLNRITAKDISFINEALSVIDTKGNRSLMKIGVSCLNILDKSFNALNDFCKLIASNDYDQYAGVKDIDEAAKKNINSIKKGKSKITNLIDSGKNKVSNVLTQSLEGLKLLRQKSFDATMGKALMNDVIKPALIDADKKIDEFLIVAEEEIKSHKEFVDRSTALRHMYANKFVKEYFEELSNDYYFAE